VFPIVPLFAILLREGEMGGVCEEAVAAAPVRVRAFRDARLTHPLLVERVVHLTAFLR